MLLLTHVVMKSYFVATAVTVATPDAGAAIALKYHELFWAADEKGTIDTFVNLP
jgi:hypothetical protein